MSPPGLTDQRLRKDMSEQWRTYKGTDMLNEAAYQAITKYTSATDVAVRTAQLEKDPATAAAFKQLLQAHDTVVLEYMLALVDQVLGYNGFLGRKFDPATFLSILKQAIAACQQPSYAGMDEMAKASNKFILWKSCRVLAHLFTVIYGAESEQGLSEFLTVLLNDMYGTSREALLVCFMQLLKKPFIRTVFVKLNGTTTLQQMLSDKDVTVQIQYQAIHCLWLLSFQKDLVTDLVEVIPRVVDIARNSQKEKVMRIALALLRNLASVDGNIERMVESKLHKQLEIWNIKRWGDEDIIADLAFLTDATTAKIDEMSSFARFRAEVLSGELEWTPVHSSEVFWRDNISAFSQDDFQLIRVLSELLNNHQTKSTTKAVACYDIGEFVRLHPSGRRVVTDLGTKKTIMGLLYDVTTEAEVQKQALLCTRKMMVRNWEMLK